MKKNIIIVCQTFIPLAYYLNICKIDHARLIQRATEEEVIDNLLASGDFFREKSRHVLVDNCRKEIKDIEDHLVKLYPKIEEIGQVEA